jgi:two-component system response regulator NreC
MDKIRVFVAFDHALLRKMLKGLINAQADMEVIGEGESIDDVLEKVADSSPHIVVTDALWPVQNGASLVGQVRKTCPSTGILLVTMTDDILLIRRILESGAMGCIGRHATDGVVLTAIRQLHQGHIFVDPELAGTVVQEVLGCRYTVHEGHKAHIAKRLSARELEVLEYLVKGYTNQQVADSLYLSVKTTETYRARLKRKLGLRNRADIVRYGLAMGILTNGGNQPMTQAT